MTCAANRTRPLVEPLLRISSASSQFTEERANHSSLRPTASVPKAASRPASEQVDLSQQPQGNVAFIRTQPDPGIRHLDHLSALFLRIPEKRKWTPRPHRPEEIRLCAQHLVGQVKVVHRRQIELHTALRLKRAKRQPIRLHSFHGRQIELRRNPAGALHSIRELKRDSGAQLPNRNRPAWVGVCDDPDFCSTGCAPANCASNALRCRSASPRSGDGGLCCGTCAETSWVMNPKRIVFRRFRPPP